MSPAPSSSRGVKGRPGGGKDERRSIAAAGAAAQREDGGPAMTMRTHELHPSLVHAPLALLPLRPSSTSPPRSARATAGSTAWAGTSGGRRPASPRHRPRRHGRVAGDRAPHDRARDMMFLHGIGNFGLVARRVRHRRVPLEPARNLTSAIAGLARRRRGALHGLPRRRARLLARRGREGARRRRGGDAGALLRAGMARLGRTPAAGSSWLIGRAYRAVIGRERVDRSALGPIAEAGTGAEEPLMH